MNRPPSITLPAILIGLIIPVALICAAWNLLAPASLCWLPVGRAIGLGAFAFAWLLCCLISEAKGETRQNAPKTRDTLADGNLIAGTPKGVGKVSAKARLAPSCPAEKNH